jgi:N-carbamoylputrescine amidase
MEQLNVALLQMTSYGFDQTANQAKGEAFCRRAADMGADIALFPEMWSVGYTFFQANLPGDRERWLAQAIHQDDPFIRHFQLLARELHMAIGLTYLEHHQSTPKNSLSLIDRNGRVVLNYSKIHTCDFGTEADLTPGDDFYVTNLETSAGMVKVGAMICFDREFPESARILMLKGAEVILVPNACEMEKLRTGQLQARAYENMIGIALSNYAAPEQKGHSVAFDGIAFSEIDGVSRDMVLVQAGEGEGIFLASFDLDALRAYRQSEVWGNAYRKPGKYKTLSSEEIQDPFVRENARR